tara:strand:- start:670 stop:1086 length:417 start_codon:yes stop_codon:yes gene_type:complete
MGNLMSNSNNYSEIDVQNTLLRNQNNELKKQLNHLKNIIEKDQIEINKLKNIIDTKKENNKKEELDQFYKNLDSSIDKYVSEMLKDEEINSVIPDYIEKKIYKNVFTLILKLMRNVTDSTKINFLDQELSLTLNSKKD